MTVLWDTSILVDVLRGHPAALVYARTLTDPPTCSEITRVEILRGVRSGERRATDRMLAAMTWVPVGEEIARRAGDLGRSLRRSHRGLATADLIIAATALELDLELATLNTRHFPGWPDLAQPYRP